MTKRKHPVLNAFQKYAFLFLGSVLASVGLEIFLIPNNIIDGGVVGISIITSHLTKIPLGLFTFLLNIPFLFFGYKQIGKTFVISSLFSITSLSIWVSLLHPIPGLTNDVLLATVFGGIILGIEKMAASSLDKKLQSPRWAALKLLEGDEKVKEKLNIPVTLLEDIERRQAKLEKEYDNDMETVIADQRYRFIADTAGKAVRKKSGEVRLTFSDKIDKVVTNRILAIPLFLAVMLAVFQVTFGEVGSFTIDWVDALVNDTVAGLVAGWLEAAGAAEWEACWYLCRKS